ARSLPQLPHSPSPFRERRMAFRFLHSPYSQRDPGRHSARRHERALQLRLATSLAIRHSSGETGNDVDHIEALAFSEFQYVFEPGPGAVHRVRFIGIPPDISRSGSRIKVIANDKIRCVVAPLERVAVGGGAGNATPVWVLPLFRLRPGNALKGTALSAQAGIRGFGSADPGPRARLQCHDARPECLAAVPEAVAAPRKVRAFEI